MIFKGDRIYVRSNAMRKHERSGIVAMAVEMGFADWVVFLWCGTPGGKRTYEVNSFNEFEIEVLERGCAVSPIPPELLAMFAETLARTREDLKKHDAGFKPFVRGYRQSLDKPEIREGIEKAHEAFRDHVEQKDMALMILHHVGMPFIRVLPKLRDPELDQNCRSAMYAALRQIIDDTICEGSPK